MHPPEKYHLPRQPLKFFKKMTRAARPCQDEMMRFLACLKESGFSRDGFCAKKQADMLLCLKTSKGKKASSVLGTKEMPWGVYLKDLRSLYKQRRPVQWPERKTDPNRIV
ncbi:hypothetical protein NDN08_004437 [Rhodosorus marinus]|uniref:COX assembly mitochondrial protein n=1 Tax=Rhodosorus marinus TaxID=101924 RepID=A0AAV8ULN8_9RHOD|nr:hypothetical protein NDN08_004437 [Rhodosorus marinus]